MPRNKVPGYVLAGPWDCDEKKSARSLTIIDIYKHFFHKNIPKDKQYWTMCGAHFGINGTPILGECGHLLDEGLIDKDQFYGVDREESIIDMNKTLFPAIKWIHGDFVDTIENNILLNSFNPAIINYDGVMQPKYGTKYLKRLLKLLDYNYEEEVLLISNFVLKNPYRSANILTYSIDETVEELSKIYWVPDHWTIIPKGYVYSGFSRNSNSIMGVIMFIKDKHNINNITITPNRKI